MIGGLAVIMTLGFAFAKIGRQIPLLKDIGGPAILCLMLPSVLVYFGVFEKHTRYGSPVDERGQFALFRHRLSGGGKHFGDEPRAVDSGMIRMFVPLVVGTLMAVLTGLLVGSLFGYTPYHTFFFIIVPIIGGGIGEGFCRCRWPIRRYWVRHLTSTWRNWHPPP